MTVERMPASGSAVDTRARLALVPTSADDPATRQWQRNRTAISSEQLLAAAIARINSLLALSPGWDGAGALPPTPIAGMVANGVLERLLFDECATPQLFPGPERGIEIEWLVNGFSVNVNVLADGEVMLAVEESDGEVLLDEAFPWWDLNAMALDQARLYLMKVSVEVTHRP